MAVSSEPRMELLPDEWEALADLERATRDIDRLYSPVEARAVLRPVTRMRAALARLDVVRGRVPVDGDRVREDERVQEASFRDDTPHKDALEKIANLDESFGDAPMDDRMRAIAVAALAAGE